MPCILFALSSFAAPTVAGFSRKRNDSTYLAGSARRRVVSEMKADAMFSRSGDHQELVFPVEGKNWFFDNTWYVATLSISFKKCKPSRDRGVKNFMMHLKCGNFLDNTLSVSSKSEEAKTHPVPSRTLWNLFALSSWKDATIYLEILLIIISNIWRMFSHGEAFCFLQKLQENTKHSSDEKSFRAHIE